MQAADPAADARTRFELWASPKLRVDLFEGVTDAAIRETRLRMALTDRNWWGRAVIAPDTQTVETWRSLTDRIYGPPGPMELDLTKP